MKAVSYTLAARKAVRKLPVDVQADIEAKLKRFAATGAGDVKALKSDGGARLRVGDYRVIVREADDRIEVVQAGHRKSIYD